MARKYDEFGERMKGYERVTTETYLDPDKPMYARIDGRAFHAFCRSLDKPFDLAVVRAMQNTAQALVRQTNAAVGYTQFDEISLGWENPSKAPYNGRLFKLCSVLASIATCKFAIECLKATKLAARLVEHPPAFDCRVCSMPTMMELGNMFLWRVKDSEKNAVASVARAVCSAEEMGHKKSADLIGLYYRKTGKNYFDLDRTLRVGSFYKRVSVEEDIDPEALTRIPPDQVPENGKCTRTKVFRVDYPNLSGLTAEQRVKYLFGPIPADRVPGSEREVVKMY